MTVKYCDTLKSCAKSPNRTPYTVLTGNFYPAYTGYAFIFCGATISWPAKKQLTIALSSTKAEYMAMTHAGKEAVFLEHIFGDVGIPFSILTTLLIDNQFTIALVENPIFHAWTKHINVCHHWVHEKVKDGNVELEYTPIADQTVDIFTKLLYSVQFEKFCADLGLSPVKSH